MASSHVIRSVLRNVLGTYTSRYSDFDGYWLFGFLIADLRELHVDLLDSVKDAPEPVEAAAGLAITRFHEQVQKARLDLGRIETSSLTLERLPKVVRGFIDGHVCDGYRLRLTIVATMDTGRSYRDECVVFVAPHDPSKEQRSVRVIA
jgi:hypothetical protein